jgi:ATP-binding cassette subfamily A (ABC1) protein 3
MADSSLAPQIQIHNLVKQYNNKASVKPAVNDLNFTLYESQITTLLGHNGSGKSTTVSLLTGLFAPTSGDCVIYGHSIVSHPTEARCSVGICSQQNILFDRLTVLETIFFFRRIKGVRSNLAEVRAHAEEIGLHDFFHTTASSLSGGNKRKLSLAIALCGDPKFLILDEPTSGMDPSSRRACWDVLRKKRSGRVILLTTHFMGRS